MYNIKIDYMRNHLNFFLLNSFTKFPAKFLTGGIIFEKLFGKYLIIREILQTCEISKNYLKPLWRGSQRVNISLDVMWDQHKKAFFKIKKHKFVWEKKNIDRKRRTKHAPGKKGQSLGNDLPVVNMFTDFRGNKYCF